MKPEIKTQKELVETSKTISSQDLRTMSPDVVKKRLGKLKSSEAERLEFIQTVLAFSFVSHLVGDKESNDMFLDASIKINLMLTAPNVIDRIIKELP